MACAQIARRAACSSREFSDAQQLYGAAATRSVAVLPLPKESLHEIELARAQQDLRVLRPRGAFEKFEAQLQLGRFGLAGEEQAVGVADSCGVVRAAQAFGEKICVSHHRVAVQKEQGLQRDVRVHPLVAADRGIGEIEKL